MPFWSTKFRTAKDKKRITLAVKRDGTGHNDDHIMFWTWEQVTYSFRFY